MAALALLALLLPSVASSPASLTPRDEFCGTDYFGYDWYCTTTATCCPGTWQSTCMPAGYTCCSTGYYCLPDEDCMLDSSGLIQYCVSADSDGSDATRSAEVEGAQETGGSGGDNGGSNGGFDEDGAVGRRVNLAWLLGVVGVGAGMMML